MDIFCEYLVKKKNPKDDFTRIGLTIACIVLTMVIAFVGFFIFPTIIGAVPILIGAVIYGTVIFRRNFSLEFEYCFTNGVLDIDVIKGRTRRNNLISIPCRKIEYMGPVHCVKETQNEVINAIYDEKRPGKYLITFSNGGQKTDVYFQPPEKLLQNMKKYNPRNIHIDE